jgi:hypothetical protein
MSKRRGSGFPPSRCGGGGGGGQGAGGGARGPQDYEQKFSEFIRMCKERKGVIDVIYINNPSVIGDNYAEIIESLNRLAEAGMGLRVAERERRPVTSADQVAITPGASGGSRPPLPLPNVSLPESGADPSKLGEAGDKGMVMNPIYAGVGEFPRLVPDEQWVATARNVLQEDGPDQFLVNLLYILRRTFGSVEWGGHLPPNVN